jgi:hypothetical protein
MTRREESASSRPDGNQRNSPKIPPYFIRGYNDHRDEAAVPRDILSRALEKSKSERIRPDLGYALSGSAGGRWMVRAVSYFLVTTSSPQRAMPERRENGYKCFFSTGVNDAWVVQEQA